MKELYITYGATLYHHNSLKIVVRKYRKVLKTVLKIHPEIVGLVSTGSSGSILAGALMLGKVAEKLVHIHVNKNGGGHGHDGVHSGIKGVKGSYIFVDDFISAGHSLERCINSFEKNGNGQKIEHAIINRCGHLFEQVKMWEVV